MKSAIKFTEIITCTWCKRRATTRGADGTFSCGQGQGDNKPAHNNLKVLYTPLVKDSVFGFERIA